MKVEGNKRTGRVTTAEGREAYNKKIQGTRIRGKDRNGNYKRRGQERR